MKTKTLSILAFLMIVSFGAKSQDFIYKKNREILKVKLIEVGTEEIKYKDFDNPDGPTFSIEKDKVSKIEMENGDIMEMKTTDRFEDPDYYTDQHKNAIKWSFTSILFNHLDFSYERSLTPSTSFEVGIGFTGIGFDPRKLDPELARSPLGVSFRGGYKFKRSPDYYLPKMRYGHLLKGGYIKPELVLSLYQEDVNYYDHTNPSEFTTERNSVASFAFIINFGKQWVLNDRLAVDMYFGIGYGGTNSKTYKSLAENDSGVANGALSQYGYLLIPVVPVVFTGGLSLGYVFGN